MTIVSEISVDMSRFETVKHFTSWLGLCPGTKTSGAKVLGKASKRSANRATQALKLAAAALRSSRSALAPTTATADCAPAWTKARLSPPPHTNSPERSTSCSPAAMNMQTKASSAMKFANANATSEAWPRKPPTSAFSSPQPPPQLENPYKNQSLRVCFLKGISACDWRAGCIWMRGTLVLVSRHCRSSRGTPRLRRLPKALHGALRLAARITTRSLVDFLREISKGPFTTLNRHPLS